MCRGECLHVRHLIKQYIHPFALNMSLLFMEDGPHFDKIVRQNRGA